MSRAPLSSQCAGYLRVLNGDTWIAVSLAQVMLCYTGAAEGCDHGVIEHPRLVGKSLSGRRLAAEWDATAIKKGPPRSLRAEQHSQITTWS